MAIEGTADQDKFKSFITNTVSQEARNFQTMLARIECFDSTIDDMPAIRSALEERWKPLVDLVKSGCVESLENIEIGDVPVLVTIPKGYKKENDHKCIYYIHGGGYSTGDPLSMLMLSGPISLQSGLKTYSIHYRLAPEHPFPAAMDDCMSVYKELIKRYKPESIALLGDSAGGALALVTTLRASQQNLALPAVLVLSSPWADIDNVGDTDHIMDGWDCVANQEKNLIKMAAAYTCKNDLKNPDISPVYAQYPSIFPPVFIITGTRDTFLSNCARLQRVLRNAGIEVRMDVWEGMWHDFIAVSFLPEAQEAAQAVGAYIKARII